jgi:uncharacterized iron-regulated membrane protein
MPSKFLMSLASLMAALQMASGLVMWWKRIAGKQRARPDAGTSAVSGKALKRGGQTHDPYFS